MRETQGRQEKNKDLRSGEFGDNTAMQSSREDELYDWYVSDDIKEEGTDVRIKKLYKTKPEKDVEDEFIRGSKMMWSDNEGTGVHYVSCEKEVESRIKKYKVNNYAIKEDENDHVREREREKKRKNKH